ncbi:MAG: PD-(D/E)XK nuclease family protein [Elusimicrobia bacterium]|nr:PD-(D/E)XK nuclease family protein [Elusimicrobiota bacterium]
MDLPRPLSHSSISMYSECPLKYKLKYVDKIPEKPKRFFSFGQSVHLALEFFYGGKTPPAPSLEELLQSLKANWVSVGYRDKAEEAEYFRQGKDILTRYHRKHAGDFALPLKVEYEFEMTVDGVPVTGKVDRVDRLEDGRLSVLDYKTGKALAVDRIETDAQLTMYQLACEACLAAEVGRLTFYHLPLLKPHSVGRRPESQVDALRRKIVETAAAIVAERFEPKPSENSCRWCDYKPYCPIFAKPAAAAAAPSPDGDLAALIDRYGDMMASAAEAEREAAQVKAAILAILRSKGYVRAFGARYEIQRSGTEKTEFPESNKKKVIRLLKDAGLYERVQAPSGPLIQKLLADPGTDPELRAVLRGLGSRVEPCDLKVTPL